ncbi:Lecithin:cholesterol acyltransferase-domain-containing protein [Entophlyctis helioformis]|nr:Lecithin:cholesterol acyltransferase-domain-containing protein [Entophlyctis helioformis]
MDDQTAADEASGLRHRSPATAAAATLQAAAAETMPHADVADKSSKEPSATTTTTTTTTTAAAAVVVTSTSTPVRWRLILAIGVLLGMSVTLFITRRQVAEQLDPLLPDHLRSDKVAESILTALGVEPDSDIAARLGDAFDPARILGAFGGRFKPASATGGDEEFLPGARLAVDEGLTLKHPVVFIPGIVSTQLEAWNPPPILTTPEDDIAAHTEHKSARCGQKYFRKRLWGTMTQLGKDGLDPPHVRLRAAQGLEAADYLFPGFWVWAKMISNFAALGADSNSMHLAAYDWRLSFANLEIRDQFFSRLKATIEIMHKGSGSKVLITAHSMGNIVFHYFLSWVRSETGGAAGEDWPDTHLAGWVNIAGPMLGVPKSLAPMISGETRESAQLNSYAASVLEQFLSRDERASLFRSWGGLASMFPKGGQGVWGKPGQRAPDAPADSPGNSFSEIITMHQIPADGTDEPVVTVLGSDQAIEFAQRAVGEPYASQWTRDYDYRAAESQADIDASVERPETWANPLLSALPTFKSGEFRIMCAHGIGTPTERKYFYEAFKGTNPTATPAPGSAGPSNVDCSLAANANAAACLDRPVLDQEGIAHTLKVSYNDPASGITNGIQASDGDGTVPLMSLGYMCAHGWRTPRYNPSNIAVVTRELSNDKPSSIIDPIVRGPDSVDHTDIMGNHRLIEDVLRMASGRGHELVDQIGSDIVDIARRVHLPQF